MEFTLESLRMAVSTSIYRRSVMWDLCNVQVNISTYLVYKLQRQIGVSVLMYKPTASTLISVLMHIIHFLSHFPFHYIQFLSITDSSRRWELWWYPFWSPVIRTWLSHQLLVPSLRDLFVLSSFHIFISSNIWLSVQCGHHISKCSSFPVQKNPQIPSGRLFWYVMEKNDAVSFIFSKFESVFSSGDVKVTPYSSGHTNVSFTDL